MCRQRKLSLFWKEDGDRYVGKEMLSAQSSVRYYIFNVGKGKDRRAVLCRELHYVYGTPPINVEYLVEPPCEEYTREELVAIAEKDFANLEDVRYHNKFELKKECLETTALRRRFRRLVFIDSSRSYRTSLL